jgi:hypothetical protein
MRIVTSLQIIYDTANQQKLRLSKTCDENPEGNPGSFESKFYDLCNRLI